MDSKTQVRERIAAIMTSTEGKACPGLAEHLAYNTDLLPTAALGVLRAHLSGASKAAAGGGIDERARLIGATGLEVNLVDASGSSDAWGAAIKRANDAQASRARLSGQVFGGAE